MAVFAIGHGHDLHLAAPVGRLRQQAARRQHFVVRVRRHHQQALRPAQQLQQIDVRKGLSSQPRQPDGF